MINLYDPKTYTKCWLHKSIEVDDEVTLSGVTGDVVAIYVNRLDDTDVWVRLQLANGQQHDFRINEKKMLPIVKFKPAPGFKKEQVRLPEYKTSGAAGFDFYSAEEKDIPPHGVWNISTGLVMEVPEGYQCEIRLRSGFAKNDVIVPNAPGTIDSDYRGEVKILLRNLAKTTYHVNVGDRIVQGVIMPAPQFDLQWSSELSDTQRGTGGFGSTGEN